MLEEGETEISSVAALAAKITPANAKILIDGIRGRSRREVEELLSIVTVDGRIMDWEPEVEIRVRLSRSEMARLDRAREVLSYGGQVPGNAEVLVKALEDLLRRRDPLVKAERAKKRAAAKVKEETKAREQVKAKSAANEAPKAGTGSASAPRPPTPSGCAPAHTKEDQGAPRHTKEVRCAPANTTQDRYAPANTTQDRCAPGHTKEVRRAPAHTPQDRCTPANTPLDRCAPAHTTQNHCAPVHTTQDRRSGPAHPKRTPVPAAERHETVLRAQGQCCEILADGTRCPERFNLEWNHQVPVCRGGTNKASNGSMTCRRHNQWRAGQMLGRDYLMSWEASRERAAKRPAEAISR
jgi:hypothetical protein